MKIKYIWFHHKYTGLVWINGVYTYCLIAFKDLKAVLNSSVVKSESLMESLKDIKHSVKLAETVGISFARGRPKFICNFFHF